MPPARWHGSAPPLAIRRRTPHGRRTASRATRSRRRAFREEQHRVHRDDRNDHHHGKRHDEFHVIWPASPMSAAGFAMAAPRRRVTPMPSPPQPRLHAAQARRQTAQETACGRTRRRRQHDGDGRVMPPTGISTTAISTVPGSRCHFPRKPAPSSPPTTDENTSAASQRQARVPWLPESARQTRRRRPRPRAVFTQHRLRASSSAARARALHARAERVGRPRSQPARAGQRQPVQSLRNPVFEGLLPIGIPPRNADQQSRPRGPPPRRAAVFGESVQQRGEHGAPFFCRVGRSVAAETAPRAPRTPPSCTNELSNPGGGPPPAGSPPLPPRQGNPAGMP